MHVLRDVIKHPSRYLGSSWFLGIVIFIFIVESAWIALSFRFPMIYDEGTHLTFIRQYSDAWWPYTNDTPGNMTTQISLFHYLLSFPYRVLEPVLGETSVIIFFRFICIALVALGLLVYARVLTKMNIPRSATNIALLVFVLLPIVPLVSATVNYDNLLFLITALYILVAVKILGSKKINAIHLMLLIIIGSIAALVKFSFLPVFAASVVFIVLRLSWLHRKRTLSQLKVSLAKIPIKKKVFLSVLFIVSLTGTIGVYGVNLVAYQSLKPSCFEIRDRDECLKNGILKRGIVAKETVNERAVLPRTNFTYSIWFDGMLKTTNWSGNHSTENKFKFAGPLPAMDLLIFVGVIIGVGALLFMWRSLPLGIPAKFGVFMFVFLAGTIFYMNYKTYYTLHAAYAIQPRYLLSLLPIIIGMVVWATYALVLKWKPYAKLAVLGLVLLLFTQGGGTITHILRSDSTWYWQDSRVIDANQTAKSILSKFVIGA